MRIEVIKKKDGRINRTNGLIINTRLRVTAYCRVSTDSLDQLNSYESQKKYYKEKITTNSEWTFVGIYADEAISGTVDYKRTDFMRMIQDGLENKFDVILTKSISRFARNTVDTLKYVRMLKEKNVAVIFEEENINTLEMSGELLLTILSSVAQQESETISAHVKLGLKMKRERGELIGFNNCLGYRYDSKLKRMTINQEEAEIVRKIFAMYCEGHGADSIARTLTKLGVVSPKGKPIWYEGTVSGILKNEKYKGDVLQGKTFTIDPISHKRVRNMGEEDQYYISNHHEAIIDEETFNLVQEIRKERRGARATGRRLGNVGRKFPLSSRLRCGFCGGTLGRRSLYVNKKMTKPGWICITSSKKGKVYCNESKIIKEEVIETAFVDAYKLLCNNKNVVSKFLNTMGDALGDSSGENEIKKLEFKREEIIKKKNTLIDLMIEGTITKDVYNEKLNKYKDSLEKIENKIDYIRMQINTNEGIENGIKKIKEIIENDNLIEEFDVDIFDALVDYVIVGGYDETGKKDPYLIRFVCKSKFDLSDDVTVEKVLDNSSLAESSFNVILDFINRQQIIVFEKNEDGFDNKRIIDKIRVRAEIE